MCHSKGISNTDLVNGFAVAPQKYSICVIKGKASSNLSAYAYN